LYVNGELIGGLDIMKEMDASGDLAESFKAASSKKMAPEPIEQRWELTNLFFTLNIAINNVFNFLRLKRLVNQAELMIFMKGDRSTPKCGFSRQLIDIVNDTKLPFETFDILTDEEVRQGLKTFSNWPTYPQVYAKGNLIGGLDIIKELKEAGELISSLKGEWMN